MDCIPLHATRQSGPNHIDRRGVQLRDLAVTSALVIPEEPVLVIPRSTATREARSARFVSIWSRKRCALAPTPLAARSGSARIARATPKKLLHAPACRSLAALGMTR